MKTCIIFGNCQCSGVRKFLEFSNFYEQYEIQQFANWQLIKDGKMNIPIHLLRNADYVIFQPLSDVYNCYSTNKSNPESFFHLLNETCNVVSFPRIHNNAIFPLFHKTIRKDFFYGKYNNSISSIDELIYLYDNNMIDFDFDNRMQNNYSISKSKEENCDIKLADFIYSNFHNEKLFLTQDHPTSSVFNYLTNKICDHMDLEYNFEKGYSITENVTGMEDSVYQRSDCQYPISRYSISHFNFRYIAKEHDDANIFYKNNLIHYFTEQQNNITK
jgi:hypothetical protein